jgi:hypothetical protein
MGVVE